ncbi:hypothetical protein M8R20_12665 [Pseudomonas sp. R2.Fl]|nr:hypothetical protein [Pseudomonas sp. R2.Fl]
MTATFTAEIAAPPSIFLFQARKSPINCPRRRGAEVIPVSSEFGEFAAIDDPDRVFPTVPGYELSTDTERLKGASPRRML